MADFIPIILDLENSSQSTLVLDEFPLPRASKPQRATPTTADFPATFRKNRNMKQLSVETGPTGAPRSPAQWKRALAEIKMDLKDRRYRVCSSRSRELLEHAKATSQITPLHLIYLHFYAATSLEMQVRSLHHTSPHRAQLLGQSRDHYRRASVLAAAEDEQASLLVSGHTPLSSPPRSPSASVSSSSSMDESLMSTPSALRAVDHEAQQAAPGKDEKKKKKKKKQVTFSDAVPVAECCTIRPDSPTLGFDEWLGRSSPDLILPEPILTMPRPLQDLSEAESEPELDHDLSSSSSSSSLCSDSEDAFARARSVHRYCTLLTGLQRQISWHVATLDRAERAAAPPPLNEEMRSIELRARIERLRADGWRRPRFDASRYEALRERALADLME